MAERPNAPALKAGDGKVRGFKSLSLRSPRRRRPFWRWTCASGRANPPPKAVWLLFRLGLGLLGHLFLSDGQLVEDRRQHAAAGEHLVGFGQGGLGLPHGALLLE